MGRKLAPEERALWGRVMATVKPLHPVSPLPFSGGVGGGAAVPTPASRQPHPNPSTKGEGLKKAKIGLKTDQNTLDSTWDRRIHKGAIIPDISVDLHGQGLATAYARLDRALEQAIHQKLRVILLVTGHARSHDRASGEGRGAIAAVVRDWLAASRHASHISAVRTAHPRHGGAGALYIVLKR